MQARVTALLVARNGGQYLERTLDALRAQTRVLDALVAVDVSSSDDTAALLMTAAPTQFVTAPARSSFGSALAQGLAAMGPATSDDEWLWLLGPDNAPEPDALAHLLGAVEIAPSVAIAGPKLMRWDAPETIAAFGESMTARGKSVQLVTNELDQAQHDRGSDLLAVASGGMLVRRRVFSALAGFDPGLPTVDAALDLCVRARLAGHRVIAVPAARVAADLTPPPFSAVRAAQLHRRLVYAPPLAVPLHWLSLLPLALARIVVQLAAKRPGRVGGELTAAIGTAFSPRVAAARRTLARSRAVGWAAIAPLRVQASQARELAANRAAVASRSAEVAVPRPGFFAAGGAWTVILLAAVGLLAFGSYLKAPALAGGSLAPLSSSAGQLWSNPATADPFSWVLALLGSLTFWSPSSSVVVLYIAAIPLAGLAAWACAARFSTRGWAPAVAAVLWALAPPFLASLHAGQLGAVVAHLALPWLVLAGVNAARSWSAAGAAALLFAITVASAPVLGPVLLLAWLAWAVANPRSLYRSWVIPVPAAVLFAPVALAQIARGTAIAILADPGVPSLFGTASAWQLALGAPAGGSNGWASVTASLGLPPAMTLVIVAALLAPLAALAVLAVFLPGSRRAIPLLALALLGFVTAVASVHLELSHVGATTTPIWPGSGLSLYWLGLAGAAVVALDSLASAVVLPALLAMLGSVALAAPLVVAPLLGGTAVVETNGRMLPAFVTAQSATVPQVGTLELTPQPDGSLAATVHRGAGTALDEQSTLAATDTAEIEGDLATLAGNLAARSGFDEADALQKAGISFVLIPEAEAGAAATARTRAADALDSNPLFVAIGETDFGYLWRYTGTAEGTPPPSASIGQLIVLGLVFGAAALLAIPTGTRRRPVAAVEGDENPADTFEEDENA
jgi:hypothetical protein